MKKFINKKNTIISTITAAFVIAGSTAAFAWSQEHGNHSADAGTPGHHQMVNSENANYQGHDGNGHHGYEGEVKHGDHGMEGHVHGRNETHIAGHDKGGKHTAGHGAHDRVNNQDNKQ